MATRWNIDDLRTKKLVSLVKQGLSDEEIGLEMGYARLTITQQRCWLGFTWNKRAGKPLKAATELTSREIDHDDQKKARLMAERGSNRLLALLNEYHQVEMVSGRRV